MDQQSDDLAPPTPRYNFDIDLDSESTHARIVALVGTDRRVLELGPATGYMSRALGERGCEVIGIEVDPQMAAQAAAHCERVIVGDLDTLDLGAELGSDRFDVIVAADVLEHLKDPLAALRRLTGFLASDGYFVISVPNVAHGSVRLALLEGHFRYAKAGLLDATHLRFFTRESVGELLDEAELATAEIYHQELTIEASEVEFDRDSVSKELLEGLEADSDARTYQYVIKAVPLAVNGLRETQRRMRELAHENARLRENAANVRDLQQALAAIASREGQLRGNLIDAHEQLLQRDLELDRLRTEILPLARLFDTIRANPIGRAYLKLRRLRTQASAVRRRVARYSAVFRNF